MSTPVDSEATADSFEDDSCAYSPSRSLASHPLPSFPCQRFPREVYDFILDEVLVDSNNDLALRLDTLQACTLVSTAWTPRAQSHLFRTVLVTDLADVHKLAEVLDEKPQLRRSVERLVICVRQGPEDYIDHNGVHVAAPGLHFRRPESAAVLFPSLLLDKVPNLSYLKLDFTGTGMEDLPPDRRTALPMPLCFPMHLARFTLITTLCLRNMVLRSFAELVRILRALPKLQVLDCGRVEWRDVGTLPAHIFKERQGLPPSHQAKLLSHLEYLSVVEMEMHVGVRCLVSVLGRSLVRLCFNLPCLLPNSELGQSIGGLELRHLPYLSEITFLLDSHPFLHDKHPTVTRHFLNGTLLHWNPTVPCKHICLVPRASSGYCTRETYLDALGRLASILESAFFDERPPELDDEASRTVVRVLITQMDLTMKDWWMEEIYACFPLFTQVDEMQVEFVDMPDHCHWVDTESMDQTPEEEEDETRDGSEYSDDVREP